MTADSLQKQSQAPAGRLFQKGQSGNPAGRRPGCRNRATLAAEVLLEGEAGAAAHAALDAPSQSHRRRERHERQPRQAS